MPPVLLNTETAAQVIWLASLRAAGRAPKTLETYAYAVDQLSGWRTSDEHPQPDGDLTTMTRLEALTYTRWLLDRYKPMGVRSRIKTLRNFFGWCMVEEMVTENPFSRVQVSVPDEDQPVVSDEMVAKMLAHAKGKPRDIAVITLLADTGCRKGELAAVAMGDVDLTSGVIRFRESKTKPRSVPLSDRAVVAVGRWLRRRGTASGSLWAVQDPYSLIKVVCRRHSGGVVSPHQFRRAFAIKWLERAGSESGLMRIAGWSTTEMVRLYSKAHADRLADQEMRRLMA